jgi:hypothetical protein
VYSVESPTEIGVIALFVVTYYYFGVKAKSAVAAHTMTLSHLCYVLKRKRNRVDPLVNQTLMFFEKVGVFTFPIATRLPLRLPVDAVWLRLLCDGLTGRSCEAAKDA